MIPPRVRGAQSNEVKAPIRGVSSPSAPRPLFDRPPPFFSLSFFLSHQKLLTLVLLVPADVEQRRPDPDDDAEDAAQSADDRVRVRPVELEGASGREDGGAALVVDVDSVAAAKGGGGDDGGSSSPHGSRSARGGGADSGAARHRHRSSAHGLEGGRKRKERN